jgi:hypothetical protein
MVISRFSWSQGYAERDWGHTIITMPRAAVQVVVVLRVAVRISRIAGRDDVEKESADHMLAPSLLKLFIKFEEYSGRTNIAISFNICLASTLNS